jgi:DNA-binding GntR family transcriptional regulator
MTLARITPTPSLADTVADRIREAILAGVFRLGEKITDDRLVEQLGVSRTPIRDAMAILAHEGLVVVRPKRGSFVFTTSGDDIAAICTYREILETQGVRLALAVARTAYLAELGTIVAAMDLALGQNDAIRYGQLDTEFHNAAFRHCANSYLRDANGLVAGRIAALRTNITAPYAERRVESMAEHRAMLEMLTANDLPGFATAIATHIGRTKAVYSKALHEGHLGTAPTQGEDHP